MESTPRADRVRRNTTEALNARIRRRTEQSVECCWAAGPRAVEERLAELDREWDIERCVEAIAPVLSLLGLALAVGGRSRRSRWLALPAVVQGFLLQHAVQGWCPPIPVLRRLGVRTADEIAEERYALKALRGDFRHVSSPWSEGQEEPTRVRDALEAARH